MTKGAVTPILIRFSLPLLVSVIFQQMYNIADSMIAGQCINNDALSAIGVSYPITMIYIAIGYGMNFGCSVIISTFFGAKDYTQMKTAVFTSLVSTSVIALFLTAVGFFTSGFFLELLGTDKRFFADAQTYLNIYVFGLLFLFLYNICTGIFTALGDSKTPLFFLIGSSLGNIGLDLLFVAVFKMGVAGAAWATFICQGICSILALLVLLKRVLAIKSGKYSLFEWKMLGKIATQSVPSIFQQSFISVGQLFIQSLINDCGPDVVAGYSSAIKLNTFAVSCISTVGGSLSSFTAQNVGGMQFGRVKKGFKVGTIAVVILAAAFTLCYLIFANNLIYMFMDETNADTTAAAEAGVHFLQVVSPFYFAVAVKLSADAVLRGGRRVVSFMITTFSDLILRVAFAFVLKPHFGATGIWLSWPVGWTTSGIISLVLCCVYIRKIGVKNTPEIL